MLAIDNTFISDDILNQHFACDISCCKGACCIEGDAGAPLEEEEIAILEDYLDEIIPFMSEKGIEVIAKMGVFDYDVDGVLVTPLVNDSECAFVYFENNVAKCAIEKAFDAKKIDFQKPISCHLYPIRVEKGAFCFFLKYHQWEICKEARKHGKDMGISLLDHLKEPLTRKYGEDWVAKIKKN
jgi:Fe-S-cluster containining protein